MAGAVIPSPAYQPLRFGVEAALSFKVASYLLSPHIISLDRSADISATLPLRTVAIHKFPGKTEPLTGLTTLPEWASKTSLPVLSGREVNKEAPIARTGVKDVHSIR